MASKSDIFGRNITGLRVSGGKQYRVHIKRGGWLSSVTGNNQNDLNNGFAGNAAGSAIDAVAISGGIYYAVHIKGEKWLPAVRGYNIKDSRYGYAGIGKFPFRKLPFRKLPFRKLFHFENLPFRKKIIINN